MRYALRKLYELEADEVDVGSVTNSNLGTILDGAICREGEFVFWRRNHSDYKVHGDASRFDHESGGSGVLHSDHREHSDHTES